MIPGKNRNNYVLILSTAYFNSKPKYPPPTSPLSVYIRAIDLYTELESGQAFPQAVICSAWETHKRILEVCAKFNPPTEGEDKQDSGIDEKCNFSEILSNLLHSSNVVLLLDDIESIP